MVSNNEGSNIFREVQWITQVWVWLLVSFAAAGAWATFILQVIVRIDPEAELVSDLVAWVVWLTVGVGLPLLLFLTRLEVVVKLDRLLVSYRPFASKTFLSQEITKCYARRYKPIREYGGWGVRWSPSNGRAYNMSGDRGVQLELADGKKLLVGSQRPEELQQAIELMLSHPSG